jgi:hypothetical protein
MTGDKLRMKRRQISFHDVQVSPTNPASTDPQQDMPTLELGPGNIRDLKERRSR